MFLGAHPPSEDPGYVVITLKVGGVEVGNAAEHAAAVVLGEPKIFRQKTVWSVCWIVGGLKTINWPIGSMYYNIIYLRIYQKDQTKCDVIQYTSPIDPMGDIWKITLVFVGVWQ